MKAPHHYLSLLVLCFLSCFSRTHAQSLGGNDFWFTFPLNYQYAQGNPGQNQLVIVSGCDATGQISFPALGGAAIPFTVTPGQPTIVDLTANNNTLSEVVENNGLHITCDNLVSVYAIDYLPFTVDGETVMPTNQLGTDYVIQGYSSNNFYTPSQFTVVATENNTVVTITTAWPTTTTSGTTTSHPAGSTWSVNMNRGQTYMVSADASGSVTSLTKSRVSANKPIAVISHAACTNYSCASCDMIMAQMIPRTMWGTKYITAQAQMRAGAGDDLEIVSGPAGANYTLNGTPYTLPAYGSRVHGMGAEANAVISSNNPIQVTQYSKGATCDGTGNTDPEHITIYPESMWITDYTFSCSTTLTAVAQGITIVANTTAGFTLDGAAIPSTGWTSIGTSTYKYLRMNVPVGRHQLKNNNNIPFAFYQYAYGNAESYIVQGGATFTNCIINGCSANFGYPNTYYCTTASNPSPTYFAGGVAGTFTATPAGLSINSSTGVINLAASTPGTYTVTNTVTSNGGCDATTTVTITAPKKGTFQYGGPYCEGSPGILPVFTGGGEAGIFSGPLNLELDSANGEINIAATPPGTYTVTNTIPAANGCPAVVETATLTITPMPVATFSFNPPYCLSGTNPAPTFTGGGRAGTFTASPAGLSISSSTGMVNLGSSTAGTYTITNTIPAGGGCPEVKATASITITAPKVPDFTYSNPYCINGNNPVPVFQNGGVAGTFTSAPAGLVFVSTATGEVKLTATLPGTYTVTNSIAAFDGCPAVSHKNNLVVNALQNAAFTYASSTFCRAGTNPTPTISGVQGGTFTAVPAGLVFVNPSTGQINLAASTINTYTITYTTPGPCANSSTFKVSITDIPVASFTYGGPFCQDAANPLPVFTNGGTAGVFTASPQGLVLNPNSGQVNLAASQPGQYLVKNTISSGGGCPPTADSATITVRAIQDALFSYLTPYCNNQGNPVPTITGVPGGLFTAVPAGLSFADNVTGEIDINATPAGAYMVTYTTPGPCPGTSTFSISITAPPVATFSFNSPFCNNGPDPLPIFSGGVPGNFSAVPNGMSINGTTGQISLANTTPGTYDVINMIPAVGGCPAVSHSEQVVVTALPKADFSYLNSPYCKTAADPLPTLAFGASNGTYSSTPGLVIDAQTGKIDIQASKSGVYTVANTIAAAAGCPAVSAVAMVVITDPLVADIAYNGPYCQNAPDPSPAFLNGGVPGSFSSVPAGVVFNDTVPGKIDLSASTPGAYNIVNTLSPAGGCPAIKGTATVVINAVQNSSFAYPAPVICKSGANPIPVISGVSGGVFTAVPAGLVFANTSTGEIDVMASALKTYTITYTTPGPCPSTTTAVVTVVDLPLAGFSYPNSPYCQTAASPLPVFNQGATAGVFSASPAGLSVNATTGLINLAASAPGTYTVTNSIAASGGCPPVSASYTITITAPKNASFLYAGTPYCKNAPDPLPVFSGGGSPGVFSSSPYGLVMDSLSGRINLASSLPGSYMVSNFIPAAGGCPAASHIAPVVILAIPAATFAYPGDPYCADAANPVPVFSGGGIAGTFTASPAGLVIDPSTGVVDLKASAPGNYTVLNTITSAAGCPPVVASSALRLLAPFTQIVSPGQNLCYGVPLLMSTIAQGGLGNYSYEWRNERNDLLSTASQYSTSAQEDQVYSIRTQDHCGILTGKVIVQVADPVIMSYAASVTEGCAPLPVALFNSSTGDFQVASWSINGQAVSTDRNQFSTMLSNPGVYTVSLTLVNTLAGCTYTEEKLDYITVHATAKAEFGYSPTEVYLIDPVIQVRNYSTDATEYVWKLDDTVISDKLQPIIKLPAAKETQYMLCLEARNQEGCNDISCRPVVVKDQVSMFVPTTFTPNGDGVNDVFKAELAGHDLEQFRMLIYDRWGEVIFESAEPGKGWDGLVKGQQAKNDVYSWKIQVKGKDRSEKTEHRGKVLLMR